MNSLPYTQEHLLAESDSTPYCPTGPYCEYIQGREGRGRERKGGGGERVRERKRVRTFVIDY